MDRVEALDPGHGRFDLALGATRDWAGATATLEARINRILSTYGEGRVGYSLESRDLDWAVLAGLRARW